MPEPHSQTLDSPILDSQILQSHIFRIQRYSIHDGPGIRTTVFFQGCPLRCRWCHNPESQAMPAHRATDGVGPLADQIMAEVEKDLIFYDDSGGGVTFSGGEPLCQADLVVALAERCRKKEIHTCLDTSGAVPWKVLARAARAVDLIYYDIKAIDPEQHKKLTGVSSDVILENLKQLDREQLNLEKHPVVLRYPLIPGCTDRPEHLAAAARFISERTTCRVIHILPFHHTAQGKYKALGMDDPMAGAAPLPSDAAEAAAAQFRCRGIEAIIGG